MAGETEAFLAVAAIGRVLHQHVRGRACGCARGPPGHVAAAVPARTLTASSRRHASQPRRVVGAPKGLTVTWAASRSISSRVPVPRPRRVAFSAPAAMPRRSASAIPMPRASPTPMAANIESPAPRSSSGSNTGPDELELGGSSVAIDQQRGRGRARDEHVSRAGGVQPARAADDIRERVAGCVVLVDELLVAELEQLDAALERRPQRRPGQVGDHELAVGAQIADQPAIQVGVDDVRGLAAGHQRHVRVEAGAERDPVQLVGRVPRERPALDADDLDALAAATVVDVDAVGRPRVGRSQRRAARPRSGRAACGLARRPARSRGPRLRRASPPAARPRSPGRRRGDAPPADRSRARS